MPVSMEKAAILLLFFVRLLFFLCVRNIFDIMVAVDYP
jgi:hypothetical protein